MSRPDDICYIAPTDPDRVDDVERQLLGACLWSDQHDTSGFDEAAEVVAPDDFGVHAHRVVFRAMLELRATNAPVNAVTIFGRLRATGAASELGPEPGVWIGDTVTLQGSDLNAGYYAHQVREASRKRRLKRAIAEMSAVAARSPRPAADVLADCEQILFDAGDMDSASTQCSASALVPEALDHIDRVASGLEPGGLPTGYADLDAITGGLVPGEVTVLAARPSTGKTALALGIATNATRGGAPALFVSLEMGRRPIMQRILSMRSGVRLDPIKRGTLNSDQAGRVDAAGRAFAKERFFLEEATPMSAARLASIVRRGVRRYGLKLVVIDYLQLMEPEDTKASKVHQIGLLSRRLKELARNCSVPIIVLAQLNRACEDRPDGKPRLSDLRDSGEIEQDADICILLSRQRGQQDANDVWLIDADVAKSRNGATGEVTLAYRRPVVRFETAAIGC